MATNPNPNPNRRGIPPPQLPVKHISIQHRILRVKLPEIERGEFLDHVARGELADEGAVAVWGWGVFVGGSGGVIAKSGGSGSGSVGAEVVVGLGGVCLDAVQEA
jgi:hypothetical protein